MEVISSRGRMSAGSGASALAWALAAMELPAHHIAVQAFRVISRLVFLALLAGATPAAADSTVYSNPAREGIRARASVDLPSGGVAQLEGQIATEAEARLGMSVSTVTYEDPDARPPRSGSHLILQSPDVSVAITISTTNRSDRARIRVERTCFYDAQVPWQPYWRSLIAFLRRSGYRIRRW